MREIIFAGVFLAVMAVIAAVLIIREDRKYKLVKDDGFVWNTQIEKRMKEENHGKKLQH